MNDRPRVGDARVRGNMLSGLEDGKENVRAAARNSREREMFDDFGGTRRALASTLNTLAIFPEMKGAPRRRVVELGPHILRRSCRHGDVRREPWIGGRKQVDKLGADNRRLRFKFGEPREMLPF